MAISVQEINNRILSALDAEGSGYYDFNRDIKPAVNYALEWSVSVLSSIVGTKKFPEEIFLELIYTKVWQTSQFSRIMIDPSDTGNTVWTILGVMPKPKTAIIDDTNLSTLPTVYYNEVIGYVGQQMDAAPEVSQAWNATGVTLMKAQESTFRPELSYLYSSYNADRLNREEWHRKNIDPFSAGFQAACDMFTQPAYLLYNNYTTNYGGYTLTVPREIEVSPELARGLVGITYVAVPDQVSLITDTVPYPEIMINVLVQKSLQFIAQKQQIGTQQYQISNQELLNLVGAID